MPRDFSQDANGYEVGIKTLQKEYARGTKNTRRTKADYDGFLERLDWCLNLYKREQREVLSELRVARCFKPKVVGTEAGRNGGAKRESNGAKKESNGAKKEAITR